MTILTINNYHYIATDPSPVKEKGWGQFHMNNTNNTFKVVHYK